MSGLSAATSDVVSVLIADSNHMQSQLLASALRRRPEFRITTCRKDTGSILQAVHFESSTSRSAVVELVREPFRGGGYLAPPSSLASRDRNPFAG